MKNTIVEYKNINKSYFGVQVLYNISLEVKEGEVLGLIGENGSGKSTMMNILGGVTEPDNGELMIVGRIYRPKNPSDASAAGIAFIHQELNLFTNLSIIDNIFIDKFPTIGNTPIIDKKKAGKIIKEHLESVNLKVSPKMLVERLAPGERQLVEIAKALSSGAQIIIFDEPTTSLTSRETEKLFKIIEKLRSEGKTIIFISHTLQDVLNLCDSVAILRDGHLIKHDKKSNFDIDKMISLMVGRKLNQLFPEKTSKKTFEKSLEIQNLSQPGVVKDINLELYKGEVLGVFGLMGSGRSELARIIFGLDPFETGCIKIHNKEVTKNSSRKAIQCGLAFITENRREEGILMDAPINENMGLASLNSFVKSFVLKFIDRKNLSKEVDSTAKSMNVKCANYNKQPVKNLSGGNQQKVVIGKWLLSAPDILILDEPTRGIDVGAKYEIYSIVNDLATKGNSILCISSELEELTGICDRIVVMGYGEIQGEIIRDNFDEQTILKMAFREYKTN